MKLRPPVVPDASAAEDPQTAEENLWFLPCPEEEEPQWPSTAPTSYAALLEDWARAEAGAAARLARVAGLFGALDDRLRRGPEGWRHRLALLEAADLSWFAGDRVAPDRLALWIALRLSGVQEDTTALARAGWAVRRLTGGPGPETDLAAFLDRRDPGSLLEHAEPFSDRADGWRALMLAALDLHPITRACMGFHVWGLTGLGQQGGPMEAALTAGRIAASEGRGAVFAPLAMGGALGLRAGGQPTQRLARWLDGMDRAILTAMRHLDDIEAWDTRAGAAMAQASGRTPPALRRALTAWPLISAPMAAAITGASRAAVQRNLAWMEGQGLIREMTGQGRFRLWRALV